MKILVLGLGVIGTTYGYIFQKAGHEVEHLVRSEKRDSTPTSLSIRLMDGRENMEGEEKEDSYTIKLADPGTEYDFILVSAACGSIKKAVKFVRENDMQGSVILFCNFWNTRAEIDAIMGKTPYILGFPAAGGRREDGKLDCALFGHVMLEGKEKAQIGNYADLEMLLESASFTPVVPYDMVEWIWIHMAINAGVTSTAAKEGKLENLELLAIDLMGDSKALAEAVRTIRETINVVDARGVDLAPYSDELSSYKRTPAPIAGRAMKKLFKQGELTRRIMTLHNDLDDILYGCNCIYDEGKKQGVAMPHYYEKMDVVYKMRKKAEEFDD